MGPCPGSQYGTTYELRDTLSSEINLTQTYNNSPRTQKYDQLLILALISGIGSPYRVDFVWTCVKMHGDTRPQEV